jgi:hypothetical protein
MLVNAKQHFPAPPHHFSGPLQGFSKLIVKNNVLCFDPTPYIFDIGFRTSGPFCMGEKLF